MTSNSPVMSS